jgi:exosortase/archaeosortase family protein
VLLLANQLFRVEPTLGLVEGTFTSLFSKSAFYYLAWYAVIRLLLDANRKIQPSWLDVAFGVLIALANFSGANSVSWLSATALGVFLLATGRSDRRFVAASVVLLALSVNGLWGRLFFDTFAVHILQADAAFVGTLLSLTQPGFSWDQTIVGMPNGHRIYIYTPCSSFHNISLGLLCWVSLTKLFRTNWVRNDFAVAAAVVGSVILLNASRLYLMALSEDHFNFWHEGFGQHLFAWTTTLAVLAISFWGAARTTGQTA